MCISHMDDLPNLCGFHELPLSADDTNFLLWNTECDTFHIGNL